MALALLQDGIEKILRVPSGQASEKGVDAFNAFRRGVTHASGGREGPPAEILGPLDSKEEVLRFLVELYVKKRLLRKQIAAVLTVLLEVDQWAQVLRSDASLLGQDAELDSVLDPYFGEVATPPAVERFVEAPLAAAPMVASTDMSPPLCSVETALPSAAASAVSSVPLGSVATEVAAVVGVSAPTGSTHTEVPNPSPSAEVAAVASVPTGSTTSVIPNPLPRIAEAAAVGGVGAPSGTTDTVVPDPCKGEAEGSVVPTGGGNRGDCSAAARVTEEEVPTSAMPPVNMPTSAPAVPAAAAFAPAPPPPPGGMAPPTRSEVQRAFDVAMKPRPAEAVAATAAAPVLGRAGPKGGAAANLELLAKAQAYIAELDFSSKNLDEAISAYEMFRKAVQNVVSSVEKEDDDVLEKLEPKSRILEFLVEFQERKKIYRARVAGTLMSLLSFPGWQAAAEMDASVQAGVRSLGIDIGVSDAPPPLATLSAISGTAPGGGGRAIHAGRINLREAASTAASQGFQGALCVRVLAAYNLANKDSKGMSDPYVRLTCGDRIKRTEMKTDTLNPKWDSAPFVFPVASLDAEVLFEVFDSDFISSDILGSTTIKVRDFQKPGSPPMRRSLGEQGELEFEMLYAAATPEDLDAFLKKGGEPKGSAGVAKPVAAVGGPAGYPAKAAAAPSVPVVPAPAAAIAAAPATAAARAHVYQVGQDVEYHSPSAARWIACKISAVHPSGSCCIDVKPGHWFTPDQMAQMLRPAASKPRPATLFAKGESVEYLSASAGRWLPCLVDQVNDEGHVMLAVKPGYWFPVEEQRTKIRKPVAGAAAGARILPDHAVGARPAAHPLAVVAKAAAGCSAPSTGRPWVAWVSIEPRKPALNFYPGQVCGMLEAAYQRGEANVDLGESFYNATVCFRPRMVQRTTKGSRDVRRVELQNKTDPVVLFLVQGADWRVAETPFTTGAQEVKATAPPGAIVNVGK